MSADLEIYLDLEWYPHPTSGDETYSYKGCAKAVARGFAEQDVRKRVADFLREHADAIESGKGEGFDLWPWVTK